MSGRVQLALNVSDIEQAVAFYGKLFGVSFAIGDPLLKLVLLENPGRGGPLNHLGVEVPDIAAVDAVQARLAQAGLAWPPVRRSRSRACRRAGMRSRT